MTQHQAPQGYFRPGADPVAQAKAVAELADYVGEFEKPRFFRYKESLCAHARSRIQGCNKCIDVCSALAIRPDGDRVAVEPHLCVGCGACTTVCPSGALTYAYPPVPDLAARIRTLLSTYASAGGRDACLLFHAEDGRDPIARLSRRGRGAPRAHPSDRGAAHRLGGHRRLAGGVRVGRYPGCSARDRQRGAAVPATPSPSRCRSPMRSPRRWATRASTSASSARRARCALAMGARVAAARRCDVCRHAREAHHGRAGDRALAMHAPTPREVIPLPVGAMYGGIVIDRDACTMCLACVGSCPEAAITDNLERPQVRFIEAKCVQCGICAATCPEHAISLVPRLDTTPGARGPRVLNEAAMVGCIRCGKPLGTQKMIDTMLAKLAGHSMFAEPGALDRLRMCGDCRVVDLVKNEDSVHVRDL
jgi:ferredoxin